MTAFAKTFDDTVPQGSALANTLDTVIQDFKTAVNERLNVEHHHLENALTIQDKLAPGRARAGLIGVMFKGTTANLATIKATRATPGNPGDGETAWGPGEGALAWDTDTNTVKRYNATTDAWEDAATLGAAAGVTTNTNASTSSGNFASYFHQNKQNTTGRTICLQLTVIAGNGVITSSTVDRAWGFMMFTGAAPPLTLLPAAFLVRKLNQSDPDMFFGGGTIFVPNGYYYYLRTYNYFKVGGSWYYSIDNGQDAGTVADFYTTSIASGALPVFQLLQTSL